MSWGYGLKNGPATWKNLYPIANGHNQSPIDIVSSRALYDVSLTANLLNFKYEVEKDIEIANTGHSVEAGIKQLSEVSGGPLRQTYRLKQFHFHWGSPEECGSEHTIEGKQYAAELHLVHYNWEKYKSYARAASKPDGLCVVAVLIETGGEHTGFRTLSQHFQKVIKPGSKCTARTLFSPYYLLPQNTRNFWSYHGSLTTPPLNESVDWIILQDNIELSEDQLSILRTLTDSDGGPMQDNFRPPCPVNRRRVRKTFL